MSDESGNTTDTGTVETAAETTAENTEQTTPGTQTQETNKQAEEPAKVGAPEKYEFKVPEGMELDTKVVAEFDPIAKRLNLSNEQAQELVNLYAGQAKAWAESIQGQQAERVQTWADAVQTDKELGGEHFNTAVADAQSIMARFLTDAGELEALKAELDRTGLGSFPPLIRLLARAGKAAKEPGSHVSGNGSQVQNSVSKTLFPYLN